MQLSQKPKLFSQIFYLFRKYTLNFEHFERKDEPHSCCISEITDCKKRGYLNAEKASCQNTYGQPTC